MLWKRTLIEHHEVWKDYTTEDPILVTKKTKTKTKTKPMTVPNNKFLLKKKKQITKNNCSGVVHAFTGFVTVSVKKIMTETVDIA